jgi:hypothetical protein
MPFDIIVLLMAERGLALGQTTIMRQAQRFVPAVEKCWDR